MSGSTVLNKPGKTVAHDIDIKINVTESYLGRGGLKLAGFLDKYPVPVNKRTVLDLGASIGGFTDCLLQGGADSVTCVDVGRSQLHQKLRNNPKVINLEGINIRTLSPKLLPHPLYDLIVMDLSFISLRKVLTIIWPLLRLNGNLILLIKPQFEVGKTEAGMAKGIIRDPLVHQRVTHEIRDYCEKHLEDYEEIGFMESPIKGADGNREFFLGIKKHPSEK